MKVQKCSLHENCVLVIINDCEFHTNTIENRKILIEELESQ
jgi:hypothetical protein